MRRPQISVTHPLLIGAKSIGHRAAPVVFPLASLIVALSSWLAADQVIVWFVGILAVYVCVGFGITFRDSSAAAAHLQFNLKSLLSMTACLSVIVASAIHQAPFRLRFAISCGAINDLASAVERGQHPDVPCRAGLFLIRDIEATQGQVKWLWTGGLGPGSPGRIGFARGISEREPRYWSQLRLDKDWWFVAED